MVKRVHAEVKYVLPDTSSEGGYVSFHDYAALEATCRELETVLSGARKLIAEGRDANFNEVGECEDDDWLARIDAWLEATASETGAEQFCSCLMPFDKKPGPHHNSTCANYEPNRGEKP